MIHITVFQVKTQEQINKSFTSVNLAYSDLEGELEINVYDDCQSEVTFKQRQGRSIKTIKADIEFDNGLVDSIYFPPSQKIPENNLLKENVLTRLFQYTLENLNCSMILNFRSVDRISKGHCQNIV